MKIATNVEIIKRKGGSLISIINGESKAEIDPARITALNEIYDHARGIDEDKRAAWLNEQHPPLSPQTNENALDRRAKETHLYKQKHTTLTMENVPNWYVTVAYELFTDNEKGIHELMEKAPEEHPFQFITGLGMALDSFEAKIAPLAEGEAFDFTLPVDEAYGPYVQEHVVELDKKLFCINDRFDKNAVYPGAVLPLVNADGNRFQGLVLEVKEGTVVINLNHPLAGKDLHFRGRVVTKRTATNDEIQGTLNMLSGEGCGCGCDDCGGGCHEHEGECCHHDDEHGCCGGHGHEHGEEHGCCGHGKGHHGEA